MSSEELINELNRALLLPVRERFARLKSLGFQAIKEYESTTNPKAEDLKRYMEILQAVRQIPSPPASYNKSQSHMLATYVELIGCANPKVLLKEATTITLESGHIAIGDRCFEIALENFHSTEKEYIELINEGKLYVFGTEGDGTFDLQIRIIEAPEPVLSMKEYKAITISTPVVILACPTGRLAICDGFLTQGFEPEIEVGITPGNYKCQVYKLKFRGYIFSYYIVLAKTNEPAINHERELPQIP